MIFLKMTKTKIRFDETAKTVFFFSINLLKPNFTKCVLTKQYNKK